jgi:hypothetical protein
MRENNANFGGTSMSCYFRHMKDLFGELGIEVTPENKKKIDAAIHTLVEVDYKDCPAAWRQVKVNLSDEELRKVFAARLKKLL